MVGMFKSIAVAGTLLMVAAPAFAQSIDTNPLGLPLVPKSLDLDPLHIFTPASKPMMHHRMRHHRAMHHRMMKPMAKKKMAKKKMATGKKMMTKKPMKKKG